MRRVESQGAHDHGGIPCGIASAALCSAIEGVVRRIAADHPRDWARVCRRVVSFALLTPDECASGAVGEFRCIGAQTIADPVFGEVPAPEDARRGVILLAPDADAGVVAHECGHAAATTETIADRQAPEDEWASELAADYLADRWGFGPVLEARRHERARLHHGPWPGEQVEVNGTTYRVDAQRVFCRVVQHVDELT